MRKKIIIKKILLVVLVFLCGLYSGFIIDDGHNNKDRDRRRLYSKRCLDSYKYINKDAACIEDFVIKKVSYNLFRENLVGYIEDKKKIGSVSEGAVFFRDLRAGPTLGINELETYSPASLLKLPLALTYMNLEEMYPGILKRTILYKGDVPPAEQVFKPTVTIEENKPYTIEELIAHMLLYSDNEAYSVLFTFLEKIPQGFEIYSQTYQDIGVLGHKNPMDENLNVHSYAGIFRMLYNVSYLDASSSEKILSWLVQSEFKEGLMKKLPNEVEVANKFGERVFDSGIKQLHDCGIVYYPENPYVLCIMTKGSEWKDLSEVIATISEMVYKEVDSRRLK